jgi:hypothetical protein
MGKKQPLSAAAEERRLSQLVEHPLQRFYNDGFGDPALKALAADIRQNGQREMIQILPANRANLPANTILDGHQRCKALRLNGEHKTTVLVRYDLAQGDELTVEAAYLAFNAQRQHRDLLLRARTALRLIEIEKKRPRGQLRPWEVSEARDRVGQAIGMSGRNLNRYFKVLRTPLEVQNAFRAADLALVVAEKVADLQPASQQKLAERLRSLQVADLPKRERKAAFDKLVAEFLPRRACEPRLGKSLAHFVEGLRQARAELAHRIPEIKSSLGGTALEDLRHGRDLIDALLAQLEKTRPPFQKVPARHSFCAHRDEEEE